METIKFVWKNILCCYGVPRELIANNGSQFQNVKLKKLCDMYGIKLKFVSVIYPQANGKAEASNKTIFHNIKKNTKGSKGN